MATDQQATVFPPPGPGSWRRLADHFPRPATAEYRVLYAETCPPAMAAYMERYGVLARTLDVAFVNGYLYVSPVALVGPPAPRSVPPRAAVWLLSRIHPTFRRRTASARRALASRPWRATTQHWFAVERDEWCRRNAAIEAVDPEAQSSSVLGEHLGACRALVADGYRRHFELHGDDLLPVGLLIARGREWGIEPEVIMATLADGPSAPHPAEVSPWMLVTGYDLDDRTWGELGGSGLGERRAATGAGTSAGLRALVPEAHHAELDDLIADARAANHLRDDNGAITAAWPMGLLRRAMLAAGRRLWTVDPDLAVEATVDELVATLGGGRQVDQMRSRRTTSTSGVGGGWRTTRSTHRSRSAPRWRCHPSAPSRARWP